MRGLVDVGRAEAAAGSARSSAGRSRRPARGVVHLPFDQAADRRPPRRSRAGRRRRRSAPASTPSRRASCSSSSRTTSARAAAFQASIGLRRRMVLHLARDRVARDGDAVDADDAGLPVGIGAWCTEQVMSSLRWHSAGRRQPRAVAPRAHHLIAAPAEIPDRRAPDVHQPGERERPGRSSCRGTDAA